MHVEFNVYVGIRIVTFISQPFVLVKKLSLKVCTYITQTDSTKFKSSDVSVTPLYDNIQMSSSTATADENKKYLRPHIEHMSGAQDEEIELSTNAAYATFQR